MSKINPNDALGPNEYAGFRAPHRPEKTTTGGPGGYYPNDPQGNVVDRSKINRTKDHVSSQGSRVFPGGTSQGEGF